SAPIVVAIRHEAEFRSFPSRLTVTIQIRFVTVESRSGGIFMGNLQAALDAPTALNVTVQATRRREVRRSGRPREYLTERQIDKLRPAPSGTRWGHRAATATLLAYRHGLRASELVALRWDDVDFRTGKLHVRRSKGGRPSVHRLVGANSAPCAACSGRASRGST